MVSPCISKFQGKINPQAKNQHINYITVSEQTVEQMSKIRVEIHLKTPNVSKPSLCTIINTDACSRVNNLRNYKKYANAQWTYVAKLKKVYL